MGKIKNALLEDLKDVRVWMKGLLGAAFAGAGNAVAAMVVKPDVFNIGAGLGNLETVAVSGAVLGGALYIAKSPLKKVFGNDQSTAR
jgi:hypothetical protein